MSYGNSRLIDMGSIYRDVRILPTDIGQTGRESLGKAPFSVARFHEWRKSGSRLNTVLEDRGYLSSSMVSFLKKVCEPATAYRLDPFMRAGTPDSTLFLNITNPDWFMSRWLGKLLSVEADQECKDLGQCEAEQVWEQSCVGKFFETTYFEVVFGRFKKLFDFDSARTEKLPRYGEGLTFEHMHVPEYMDQLERRFGELLIEGHRSIVDSFTKLKNEKAKPDLNRSVSVRTKGNDSDAGSQSSSIGKFVRSAGSKLRGSVRAITGTKRKDAKDDPDEGNFSRTGSKRRSKTGGVDTSKAKRAKKAKDVSESVEETEQLTDGIAELNTSMIDNEYDFDDNSEDAPTTSRKISVKPAQDTDGKKRQRANKVEPKAPAAVWESARDEPDFAWE